MERKKCKRILHEICLRGVIFVVVSAVNSVSTSLELAAFDSSPDAKYSRASAS